MITYHIFIKNFSRTGYSLLVVKESDKFLSFQPELFFTFPFFTKKQTRLLDSVFINIRNKVASLQINDVYEDERFELYIPPTQFFSSLESLFLRKLTVLCNNLSTNSNRKLSIKSYKLSLITFFKYKKLRKIKNSEQWYQYQNSMSNIDISEF